MYKALLTNQCTTTAQQQQQWLRLWHMDTLPKFRLYIWKCLQNILPLKDYMFKLGIVANDLCPLCSLYPESFDHLFFHCDFSRAIWFQLCPQIFAIIHKFGSLKDWILHWFAEKITYGSPEVLNLYILILWQIWKARCSAGMENKTQCHVFTIHEIQILLESLIQTLESSEELLCYYSFLYSA